MIKGFTSFWGKSKAERLKLVIVVLVEGNFSMTVSEGMDGVVVYSNDIGFEVGAGRNTLSLAKHGTMDGSNEWTAEIGALRKSEAKWFSSAKGV